MTKFIEVTLIDNNDEAQKTKSLINTNYIESIDNEDHKKIGEITIIWLKKHNAMFRSTTSIEDIKKQLGIN